MRRHSSPLQRPSPFIKTDHIHQSFLHRTITLSSPLASHLNSLLLYGLFSLFAGFLGRLFAVDSDDTFSFVASQLIMSAAERVQNHPVYVQAQGKANYYITQLDKEVITDL